MVIDTSVFIEFLRKKDKTNTILYSISEVDPLAISSVTLYELLMGATDSKKLYDIQLLTEDLLILPFDDRVAAKSGEIYHQLRKENKMIEFRDIFIAATCIIYQMPLKTLNTKHFERISGLNVL
jgi:predicted nucleic acid-binding protein